MLGTPLQSFSRLSEADSEGVDAVGAVDDVLSADESAEAAGSAPDAAPVMSMSDGRTVSSVSRRILFQDSARELRSNLGKALAHVTDWASSCESHEY